MEKERQVKIWIKKLLSYICEIDVYNVNIYHILQIYNDAVKHAREEMETNERPQGLVPPCSTDLRNVHFTFDFAQALAVPHHARHLVKYNCLALPLKAHTSNSTTSWMRIKELGKTELVSKVPME